MGSPDILRNAGVPQVRRERAGRITTGLAAVAVGAAALTLPDAPASFAFGPDRSYVVVEGKRQALETQLSALMERSALPIKGLAERKGGMIEGFGYPIAVGGPSHANADIPVAVVGDPHLDGKRYLSVYATETSGQTDFHSLTVSAQVEDKRLAAEGPGDRANPNPTPIVGVDLMELRKDPDGHFSLTTLNIQPGTQGISTVRSTRPDFNGGQITEEDLAFIEFTVATALAQAEAEAPLTLAA